MASRGSRNKRWYLYVLSKLEERWLTAHLFPWNFSKYGELSMMPMTDYPKSYGIRLFLLVQGYMMSGCAITDLLLVCGAWVKKSCFHSQHNRIWLHSIIAIVFLKFVRTLYIVHQLQRRCIKENSCEQKANSYFIQNSYGLCPPGNEKKILELLLSIVLSANVHFLSIARDWSTDDQIKTCVNDQCWRQF